MKRMVPILLATFVVLLSNTTYGWTADFEKGATAFENGDYVTAIREWTALAEQGEAKAQRVLGLMYYHGEGVPQDYRTALKFLTLAAEQGLAPAQNNLGVMYRDGVGVPQDLKKAGELFTLADEQTIPDSKTRGEESLDDPRLWSPPEFLPMFVAELQSYSALGTGIVFFLVPLLVVFLAAVKLGNKKIGRLSYLVKVVQVLMLTFVVYATEWTATRTEGSNAFFQERLETHWLMPLGVTWFYEFFFPALYLLCNFFAWRWLSQRLRDCGLHWHWSLIALFPSIKYLIFVYAAFPKSKTTAV